MTVRSFVVFNLMSFFAGMLMMIWILAGGPQKSLKTTNLTTRTATKVQIITDTARTFIRRVSRDQ